MEITSRPERSSFVPEVDTQLSQSPSSSGFSGDYSRRSSHARAQSSLGSANMFDFFGPSSLASNGTTATSFHFGSPGGSPKANAALHAAGSESDSQRNSLDDTVDAREPRLTSEEPTSNIAPQDASDADNANTVITNPEELDAARLGLPAAPMPPLYPEETLPSYEESPEYTPPLSQSSGSNSRSKTSAFRAAAANRFLSSRIGKKLNLPPALQSRLQGTQTPDAQPQSSTSHSDGRIRFVRSDSAPDLARSTQSIGRRRIVVHNYAATQYVNGARMGPAPRQPRPASRRSATAGGESSRSLPAASSTARPATSMSFASSDRRQTRASPMLRSAASSVSSSRRNSGESRSSRPASRATISSAPNGGLFTCGYTSNRSGATTPTSTGLSRKIRSRNVSIKSLGDFFSIKRDRERSRPGTANDDDQQQRQALQPAEIISPRTTLREVIAPVSHETLISARVHQNTTARPILMNAAHSSPRAGVDAAGSGSPILIGPYQSQPDPLQKLPREIILTIFRSLVDLHVQEHKEAIEQGVWRGKKATETPWVGAEAAVRELARLSRVSRTWQSYVLDGQLWQNLEFSKYPGMAEEAMINIAKAVGPFVRRLDLHGLASLRSSVLVAISKAQRPRSLAEMELQGAASPCVPFAACQLEELDLEGCRRISTSALNTVLSRSANLKKCKLASLPCVDNTTLCMLAATATKLEYLDISRCRSVDAEGIRAYFAIQESEANISAVLKERNSGSKFRELHAAGVAGFDGQTLAQLGRHWPNLEVLNLSYCTDVNDATIAALVSSDGDVISEKGNFVTLTPRQAGSQQDDEVVRRTFPHLKRLGLSSCRALTDRACVSLSHAVPMLETLELANVGAPLRDAGLVRLFTTTPHLHKLDLERATQITDAVLSALTPPESHAEAFGRAVPDRDTLMHGTRLRGSLLHMARRSASRRRNLNPTAREDAPPSYDQGSVAALIPATGTHLTHLILSSANHLTAEAMMLLINRCPFLIHLEVDDTHADNEVATQFVQLARYRKVRNAYLSLVDCRSFSRDTYSHLNHNDEANGGVRPRQGSRGYAFRHFSYDDPEPSPTAAVASTQAVEANTDVAAGSTRPHRERASGQARSSVELRDRDRGHDECNDLKPVVKSFWGWQLVDARMKQKRKAEQRAAARRGGRGKVGNVVAMALGLPVGAGAAAEEERFTGIGAGVMGGRARWSRVLMGSEGGLGQSSADEEEDNEDDARGCTIM